jgi:hypothetical protein
MKKTKKTEKTNRIAGGCCQPQASSYVNHTLPLATNPPCFGMVIGLRGNHHAMFFQIMTPDNMKSIIFSDKSIFFLHYWG